MSRDSTIVTPGGDTSATASIAAAMSVAATDRQVAGASLSSCWLMPWNVGSQRVGLLVDQLIGQEEVVIKPLGSRLHGTPGLAGATITGDGHIALILDLPMLVRHYARRSYPEVA